MTWTLAGNLECRADAIRAEFPGIVIYSIGDTSHASGQSDHNPDARSIVHAIDPMTYDDETRGWAIVQWALADPTDLEYVIYQRQIWSRSNGFEPDDYDGSNPHTDHPHLSGKHGDTGYSSATGTGYDTDAERYRPEGFDTMTPDQVKDAVLDALNTRIPFASNGVAAWAATIGSGDPISHRMMQEHMWARAGIDNPAMTDPGPLELALQEIQTTLAAIAASLGVTT